MCQTEEVAEILVQLDVGVHANRQGSLRVISGQEDLLARMSTGREAETGTRGDDLRHESGQIATVHGGVITLLALLHGDRAVLIIFAVVQGIHLLVGQLKAGIGTEDVLHLAVGHAVDLLGKALGSQFIEGELVEKLIFGQLVVA